MIENGDGVGMSNCGFRQDNQIPNATQDTPKLCISGSRWQQDCYLIVSAKVLDRSKFEGTKGAIRRHKSKTDRHGNDQKKKGQNDKQRSTKHYTEN